MSKLLPSTGSNRYYLTRMKAAKHNERLKSREGASEETGVDRNRLQKMEIGTLNPYPEEVMLLADAYNAPELLNFHCARDCPIGKKIMPNVELSDINRLAIRFLNALEALKGTDIKMLEIAKDGELSKDEIPIAKKILEAAKEVSTVAYEVQIYIEKQNEWSKK